MDCGLRTTDYGLGIKHGLRYKMRTKHYGLGIFFYWFYQLQQLQRDLHYKKGSLRSTYLRITIYILLHTTRITVYHLQKKNT